MRAASARDGQGGVLAPGWERHRVPCVPCPPASPCRRVFRQRHLCRLTLTLWCQSRASAEDRLSMGAWRCSIAGDEAAADSRALRHVAGPAQVTKFTTLGTLFLGVGAGLVADSVQRCLFLRGAIAFGETVLDPPANTLLRQAIVDAYVCETSQEWVGLASPDGRRASEGPRGRRRLPRAWKGASNERPAGARGSVSARRRRRRRPLPCCVCMRAGTRPPTATAASVFFALGPTN